MTYKLTLSLILASYALAGCSASPPQKSLYMYANQNTDQLRNPYFKTYIVHPENDPLELSTTIANTLSSQGIPSELYTGRDFFAPQGTGFFITNDGYILTCDHVLGDRTSITFKHQGEERRAKILFRDPVNDLALLKTEDTGPYQTIPIAPALHLGDQVFALGYPLSGLLGIAPRLTAGIVSARVGFADEPSRFQMSAPIQPGNSGGPVLNSLGELIGIAQSTLNSDEAKNYTGGVLPQNVNFAITTPTIYQFLRSSETLGVFPVGQAQRLYERSNQTQSRTQGLQRAEAASVLISGAPQSQQEALVIALEYRPSQVQYTPNRLEAPLEVLSIVQEAQLLEIPRLTLQALTNLLEPTQPTPPANEQRSALLAGFTITLYDFRSKKPLFKMQQVNQSAQSNLVLRESLLQLSSFLPMQNYASSLQPVATGGHTNQAAFEVHGERLLERLPKTTDVDQQH